MDLVGPGLSSTSPLSIMSMILKAVMDVVVGEREFDKTPRVISKYKPLFLSISLLQRWFTKIWVVKSVTLQLRWMIMIKSRHNIDGGWGE